MAENKEDGFEFKGEFYRWSVSDGAKDLMLIDRFTGLPAPEFFESIQDSFDRGRGPILLTLLATSISAKNPEWTVERTVRTVMGLSLSEVTFIDADEDEEPESPLEEETEPVTSSSSVSTADE